MVSCSTSSGTLGPDGQGGLLQPLAGLGSHDRARRARRRQLDDPEAVVTGEIGVEAPPQRLMEALGPVPHRTPEPTPLPASCPRPQLLSVGADSHCPTHRSRSSHTFAPLVVEVQARLMPPVSFAHGQASAIATVPVGVRTGVSGLACAHGVEPVHDARVLDIFPHSAGVTCTVPGELQFELWWRWVSPLPGREVHRRCGSTNRTRPSSDHGRTTGDIEALSLWAGQSVALARQPQPAAEIVAEFVSGL
jgi:hypothetical protein